LGNHWVHVLATNISVCLFHKSMDYTTRRSKTGAPGRIDSVMPPTNAYHVATYSTSCIAPQGTGLPYAPVGTPRISLYMAFESRAALSTKTPYHQQVPTHWRKLLAVHFKRLMIQSKTCPKKRNGSIRLFEQSHLLGLSLAVAPA
jgi:hypothetical protein